MFSFLYLLPAAFAADDTINILPGAGSEFENLGTITFPDIIKGMVGLVLIIAAIVFFFILVVGGIKWIISGGDKAQTEGARNQITAALVGLVVIFAAWAIIQLIQTFFGIRILEGLKIPKI